MFVLLVKNAEIRRGSCNAFHPLVGNRPSSGVSAASLGTDIMLPSTVGVFAGSSARPEAISALSGVFSASPELFSISSDEGRTAANASFSLT